MLPSSQPSAEPTDQPSTQPSSVPTSEPSLRTLEQQAEYVLSVLENITLSINSTEVRKAFDFNISFIAASEIPFNQWIHIRLPKFTRYLSEDKKNLSSEVSWYEDQISISPSYYWQAGWLDSTYDITNDETPYPTSTLILKIKDQYSGFFVEKRETVTITVHSENGIGAFCGHQSWDVYNGTGEGLRKDYDPFKITVGLTNSSSASFALGSVPFSYWSGVGQGCADVSDCSGHGTCDYCYERCSCYQGYGHASDVVMVGGGVQPDCSARICPVGKMFGGAVSPSLDQSHDLAECSNNGLCDRGTGQCSCFNGYEGAACQRSKCPNDCSGRGKCVSMREMARLQRVANPGQYSAEYGTITGLKNAAVWDADSIFGCKCDSISWDAGYKENQVQLSEYFGGDCSLRRCPSGDDPFTRVDEEDCWGANQLGLTSEWGQYGNKCQVDCSNRGTCNYQTGKCACYGGHWGKNCAYTDTFFMGHDTNANHTKDIPWAFELSYIS